jgi:hypothetical protein
MSVIVMSATTMPTEKAKVSGITMSVMVVLAKIMRPGQVETQLLEVILLDILSHVKQAHRPKTGMITITRK